MAINRNFRVCATTGVVCLLAGGILALLVTLTRWPAVGNLLQADWFYLALTAHGYEHMAAETSTRTGTYSIICNEDCGINHSTMSSKLYIVKK